MALTRPYLGVHYPSDVVAGALLGGAWAAGVPRRHEDRHRRAAQRGQVVPVQRPHRADAPAANYPFTTLEPNVAVVGVPDERLEQVAETIGATPIVHETIQFHDIAGLVRGAHQGEGLGNQFLGNIRETDAILHVVRVHDDAQVVHPEGSVDPLADVETIETELLYADLEQAERRLERVAKQAKSGDKELVAEERWLRERGRCAARGPGRADRAGAGRGRRCRRASRR